MQGNFPFAGLLAVCSLPIAPENKNTLYQNKREGANAYVIQILIRCNF